MKLKIIGSGAIWTKSNSASYLIDDNILVDIPNGTCKELRRLEVNPQTINHVLITHFHGDHYFDIPFYLLAKMSTNEKDKTFIYTSKDGINKIKKTLKLAFPNSVKKINNKTEISYITSKNFMINNYKVEKILVDHGNMKPAYGYILEKDNLKVGFTGDSCLCPAIEVMASSCNHLICDCASIKGSDKHMGIDNIVYLAKKYQQCKIYTTHMNDETKEELKKINNKNIIILNDSDVFVLI